MTTLKSILLVDDNEIDTFFHRSVLEKMGVVEHIAEAYDGQEALDYLQQAEQMPELIFLDINMPIMDGWEFLERFKQSGFDHRTVVVMMLTTSLNPDDAERAARLQELSGFITKPLKEEDMQKIVYEHFPSLSPD
ncbi:MAG: response regulator [Oceanococcaceae bacterium]